MANSDSSKQASDRGHESYADDAKAQRVLIVDSEGSVATGTPAYEGTLTKSNVTNTNAEELLVEIFKELKIVNYHLSIITDNKIDKEDII